MQWTPNLTFPLMNHLLPTNTIPSPMVVINMTIKPIVAKEGTSTSETWQTSCKNIQSTPEDRNSCKATIFWKTLTLEGWKHVSTFGGCTTIRNSSSKPRSSSCHSSGWRYIDFHIVKKQLFPASYRSQVPLAPPLLDLRRATNWRKTIFGPGFSNKI